MDDKTKALNIYTTINKKEDNEEGEEDYTLDDLATHMTNNGWNNL
jgi:hypothetical protein